MRRSTPNLLSPLLFATLLSGCGLLHDRPPAPHPVEYAIESPYPEVRTLAVAPAVNLSGSRDFDPLVVSDTLYTELQQVQGLNVLSLNKTLLAMQRLGIRNIDDVRTAQKLAEILGADGLVIPSITVYNPYSPPSVGIVLQMYTPRASMIGTEAIRTNRASVAADGAERQPVSQVTAVFNGSNQSVLRELRHYASGRTEYDSALQEQKFLLDADAYMRFVCNAMVRRLMDVERSRTADR